MNLTMPVTIADLISARSQIIESWHEVNRSIDAIEAAFARIHDNDFHFLDSDSHRGRQWEKRQDKVEIPQMTADLDYSLFVFALGKLNITNAMTAGAKDAFLEKIKKAKTVFDETQLTGLAQNASTIFKDSSLNTVREVFRKCIGTSYRADTGSRLEKKRDNLQKVERNFRVGWSDIGLNYSGSIECQRWDHRPDSGAFRFNDLLTACRLIEGEGIPDYSNNMDAFCRLVPKGQKWVDTGYFVAQKYLNGNVKVKWNEDKIHILEKLNAIGSGRENAMPDTMRKRYKSEHFHGGGVAKAETFFNPEGIEPSDEKDFAFYPTPESVARRMVELAEYPPEEENELVTLEPSAGDGGLVNVIPWDFGCTAVEFNHHRALKLRKLVPTTWHIEEADFLKWRPSENIPKQFDRVLMNPPFNDRAEAYHIIKAFSHLRPGGILVAILPEGWFTRNDQKSTVLRSFLQEHEHKPSEVLPAGTFARTKIATRIVTLKKATV